jgi:hypothetical protein
MPYHTAFQSKPTSFNPRDAAKMTAAAARLSVVAAADDLMQLPLPLLLLCVCDELCSPWLLQALHLQAVERVAT